MGYGIMTNYGQRSESFWIKESIEYIIDAGQGVNGSDIIKNFTNRDLFNQFHGINCFVISHGDSDHISLAKEIVINLQPEVIVISPLVFAINNYRYTVQDILNQTYPKEIYLPNEFFNQNDDNYNLKNGLININDVEINHPIIYIQRRDINRRNATLPWDLDIPNTDVPEFETYPTKSSLIYAKFVVDFVNQLKTSELTEINRILQSNRFIKDLCKGRIPDRNYTPEQYMRLFENIENNILKLIRNDMSLICRVGKTVFTGDANKEQLNEVNTILAQRATQLNHNLTIKINHHCSPTKSYQNLNFYYSLSPIQLLLKRDDRVENASGFNQYRNQLNSCACRSRFIDSDNGKDVVGIPFIT